MVRNNGKKVCLLLVIAGFFLLIRVSSLMPEQPGSQSIQSLKLKLRHCVTKKDSANCYRQLGDEYAKLGMSDDALKCYQEAEPLSAQTHHFLNLFLVRFKIGKLLQGKSEYGSAVRYYQEGQRAYGQLSEEQKGVAFVQQNLAAIYNNQGTIHRFWGESSEALDQYEKALKILESFPTKNIECSLRLNLGVLYSESAEYEKALDEAKRCQDLAGQVGDHQTLAKCYSLLASIYGRLGDFDKRFEYNKSALNLARNTYNYINLSTDYLRRGELDEAFKLAQQGLNLAEDQIEKASAHTQIGDIYSERREWRKALNSYNKALPLQRRLGYTRGLVALYNKLGKLHYNLFEFNRSLTDFKNASSLIQGMEIPDITWYTFYGLGKVYEARKAPQKALDSYKKAIESIEGIRKGLKVPEYRASFIEDKLVAYEALISLLVKMRDYAEAFNYAERARSRAFLDMLGNPKVHLQPKKSSELYEKEQRLSQQITFLEEKLYGQRRYKNYREVSKITKRLKKLRREYGDLLLQIKTDAPELNSLVSVEPVSLAAVHNLLNPTVAIVGYFITEYQIYIWVISKDQLNFVKIDKKAIDLRNEVNQFRSAISRSQQGKDVNIEKWSQALYATLISPVKSSLNCTTIGVVPHDVLHYLPFHALSDGKGYLIDDYEVFYVPSCSILRFCVAKRKGSQGRILALGNPDLGSQEFDLPYAEQEVEGIAGVYPQTRILVRERATETAVKNRDRIYDVLHLACHGELQMDQPLFSCLRLTKDTYNDGSLKVYEVFQMEMNANLAVLSACQTALGKWSRGDELVGLSRAFIYAGASSVVASLWRVADPSTARLMENFYNNLKNGQGKARALREAQLQLRDRYNNPFYWTPFVLIGDWE